MNIRRTIPPGKQRPVMPLAIRGSLGEADICVQGNTFSGKRICVEIQVRVGPRLEKPFPVDLLEFIDEESEIVVIALSRTALCGTQTYLP